MTQTFPGVYIQVTDNSYTPARTSRYNPGLVGVASKGPFNQRVSVQSLQDFVNKFGLPVQGQFLAHAVAAIASISDGTDVVRVGNQYGSVSTGGASGAAGTYTVNVSNANLINPNDYIRVSQNGLPTTANARVQAVNGAVVTLVSVGVDASPLAATYTNAVVDRSVTPGAANESEGFLKSPTYGAAVSAVGTVVGTKNAYQFTVSGDQTALSPGDIIKITQTGRASTREVMVKDVLANQVVTLEPVNRGDIGYQASPLQDNYTSGVVYKVTGYVQSLHVMASSAGTWGNTLSVKVLPGSAPDTRKLQVFSGASLLETIDNLSADPASANYYPTRINGHSSMINVYVSTSPLEPVANSQIAWSGAIVNSSSFTNGSDGAFPSVADYVGTIDPANDTPTGLKVFDDTDANPASAVCAPGISDIGVLQEVARITRKINAAGIGDIPKGLNGREAIDWHNGAGLYYGQGRIDSAYLTCFWNWIYTNSVFDGSQIMVPPSIGALYAQAYTFDRVKPWYAACGPKRGRLPWATGVQYPRLSDDVKQSMYGNGNSVNPILINRKTVAVWGERTMQVAETRLSVMHGVVLINAVVNALADIGRNYVFDPNDATLLSNVRLDYIKYLDGVKNDRGIMSYNLTLDSSNNNATTRSNRQVVVDLSVVDVETADVFLINAAVSNETVVVNSVS